MGCRVRIVEAPDTRLLMIMAGGKAKKPAALRVVLAANRNEGAYMNWMENLLLRMDAQGDPNASIELVSLYRDSTPLSALAFARKAARLGMDIELTPHQTAVDHLRPAEYSADPIGSYRLGAELASYPVDSADTRKSVMLLKAAAEADAPCSGPAAFCLADLLSSLGGNAAEAYRYYAIAESKGFWDLLPSPHKTKRAATDVA